MTEYTFWMQHKWERCFHLEQISLLFQFDKLKFIKTFFWTLWLVLIFNLYKSSLYFRHISLYLDFNLTTSSSSSWPNFNNIPHNTGSDFAINVSICRKKLWWNVKQLLRMLTYLHKQKNNNKLQPITMDIFILMRIAMSWYS